MKTKLKEIISISLISIGVILIGIGFGVSSAPKKYNLTTPDVGLKSVEEFGYDHQDYIKFSDNTGRFSIVKSSDNRSVRYEVVEVMAQTPQSLQEQLNSLAENLTNEDTTARLVTITQTKDNHYLVTFEVK